MADIEGNKQSDFLIEKIKERPVNKKKLLRRTIITATMAVMFGLIACLTFLVLEPVISNWLYPEEKPDIVYFPEEEDEMSPEDMLVEDKDEFEEEKASLEEALKALASEDERIQKLVETLSNPVLDKENYEELYKSMSDFVKELSTSMVTVTGVSSEVDWLNDIYQTEGVTYGVIIADNSLEYLILTEWSTIKDAQNIKVTFCDESSADAYLKMKDEQTDLAVIAVDMGALSEETTGKISQAIFGSSSFHRPVGTPVVALGRPLGNMGSVGYGIIATEAFSLQKADVNYKLFTTDIYGSTNGTGVLFNMKGKVIGVITRERASADMPNAVSVIGISELRKLVEKMTNGKEMPYLGIKGVDVTKEANENLGVPLGAYVEEIEPDSPALAAGIQRGDVIVGMDESVIANFAGFTTSLRSKEPGETVTVVVARLVQDTYKEMEIEITLGTAR